MASEGLESTLSVETNHGIDGIETDGSVWLKTREKMIASSIPEFSSKALSTVFWIDDKETHKTERRVMSNDSASGDPMVIDG